MRALTIAVLALACCAVQQALVVAVAQDQRPRVAINHAGQADATVPGIADGVWSPALTGERRPLYRLHLNDVLQIGFTFSPEYDQELTVQPDGYIMLKSAAPVYAEDKTLPELQAAIQFAYATILNDPEVNLILKQFDKPSFFASGQVAHPGKYELGHDVTVTEALAMAGGLTEKAKHSQVVLFRHTSHDQVETRLLNVKEMLKSKDLAEDIHLRPDDMLFVPQNVISKISRYLPVSSLAMYVNP